MSTTVAALSVDLEAKTATFKSGMADAAKTARGAFTEIQSGSSEMGEHVSTNMFASRHAIMAVSEAFGDTMPRAITALLVHLGPVGAALEAAFPYAAIGLAAVLLIEHMTKMREESEKLAQTQMQFGTTINTTFDSLDQKMLQAEIRSDELRNDHLGALHHQLELINKQSLSELVHEFGIVEKAADEVFKGLQSHWYTFGIGSAGAQHALDTFKAQYESLLAQGKDKEASDLLRGTRESAEKVLAMLGQAKTALAGESGKGGTDIEDHLKYAEAMKVLNAANLSGTKQELQAQEALVQALQAQATIEEKVASLRKQDASNATTQTGNEAAAMKAAGARAHAQAMLQVNESALAADRSAATTALEIQRASIAERLASDIAFADRDYQLKMAANAQETAALDKAAKDYTNQLKGMHDKALELEQSHTTAVAELRNRAALEQAQKDARDREESLRETIDATEKGSAARLAALDAGIRAEQALNLQDTSFYRDLLTQRVQTIREAAAEEAKLRADAGREAADNDAKMGELRLAAQQEYQALMDSSRRMTLQMRIEEETKAANQLYALQLTALQRAEDALNKGDKDYLNKLQALQDREAQLTRAHENQITSIKDQAQKERNAKILSAENRYMDEIASGLTQAIMGQKSFGAAMAAVANDVESSLLQAAIKHIETNLLTKQSDAAKAARAGFHAGLEMPFPFNLVAAPLFAAGMYAEVMAFSGGTDYVPGATRGDTVPAMLTPGEGVVPGGVMDGLRTMARNGGFDQSQPSMTMHYRPTFHVQTIDRTGVQTMLDKHHDAFEQHLRWTMRKMNR